MYGIMSKNMIARALRSIKRRIVARLPKRIVQMPVDVPVLQGDLLKGRRALITGGTSGIGFAMARAFLRHGAEVIVTGRSESRVAAAVAALTSDAAHGLVLDNTQVESFGAKVDGCAARFGLPDVLVNNAGVIATRTFGNTEAANYDLVMDTNLRGSYFLSQELANRWKAAGTKANILNVGSSSSLRPGNSPYVLSKWGMRSMTLGLAKELVEHGIVVNGIAPGPTATKMFVGDGANGINWPNSPAGRLATEEEIANLAVVLVSDLGRMVVGDMLFATGGCGTVTVDDIG